MICTIVGRELKDINDMNNFGLWTKGCRCYEQFRAMDEMNDYESWAMGSRCYE